MFTKANGLASVSAPFLPEPHQLDLLLYSGDYGLAAEAVAGLAAVAAAAAAEGDAHKCAELLGAARAIGSIADPPIEASLERRFYALARRSLGHERWEAHERTGQGKSPREAITTALTLRTHGSAQA